MGQHCAASVYRAMKVCVLGAGVAGMTSAYFLAQAGHDVTVVERNAGVGMETSYANGGQLSYSYVAPLSWDIVEHVNHAREEMNFSAWGTYDSATVQDKLIAICRQVRSGEMPLPSYARIHRSTRLSADDVSRLCAWTSEQRKALRDAE